MGPLCVTLLLVTPFIAYIHHHQYNLFVVEILLVVGVLVLIGLCLGLLVARSQEISQALLLTALITISIDLSSREESLTFLLGLLLVIYFVVRILQRHILSIVSIMCLAAILSNALVPGQEIYRYSEVADANASKLPPVIHLILDEYMSADALPPEVDADGSLRLEITDFFVQNGFDVAGGAYSQYFNTYNSIGNTLNFESSSTDAYQFLNASEPYVLKTSAYFENLAAEGYRFRIYQSSFLDYCRVPAIEILSCFTYESASIKYVEDVPLPSMQKADFILGDFGRLSKLRVLTRRLYNRLQAAEFTKGLLPFWQNSLTAYGPIPTLSLFDQIAEDVSKSPGGEVFFAHLLIPHSAYILDDDCIVRSNLEMWRSRKAKIYSVNQANTESSRISTYMAYIKQLRCTNQLLAEFFDQLRSSGQFESATIILHGDHGSRINLSWASAGNFERLVDSDFKDGFPTLFATKTPGTKAGYSGTPKTLSRLLAEAMGVKGPEETQIFLFSGKGKAMIPHAMPDSWHSALPGLMP